MSDLEYLQPQHGGMSSGTSTRIIAPRAEPRRTDNFRPATITASTNGSIQEPPSMLPVFFGAGLAMLIILNSGRGSLFTLNFG